MVLASKPVNLSVLLAAALLMLAGCARQSVANGALPTPSTIVLSNPGLNNAPVVVGSDASAAALPRQNAGAEPTPGVTPQSPAVAATQPAPAGPPAPASPSPAPAAPVVVPTPVPAPAADSSAPQADAAPLPADSVACGQTYVHVVAAGENLFRIALRYKASVDAIARDNGISNAHVIRLGQSLSVVACKRTSTGQAGAGAPYIVQRGDNLFRIALRHGTTVAELMAANGLASDSIYAGQRLYLP